jgi:hypothetical protein
MRYGTLAMAIGCLLALNTQAQGLRAVRPLSGYACMMLSSPPAATINSIRQVPVRSSPSASGSPAGWAPSVVLVSIPLEAANGFLEATFPDGHKGWIAASDLKPWSSPYNPNRRCIPSVMSDGGFGFDFR